MLKTKSHEEFTITEALRVAAETYDQDANLARMAKEPRVEQQFRAQAAAARRLCERISEGQLSLPTFYLSDTGRTLLSKEG